MSPRLEPRLRSVLFALVVLALAVPASAHEMGAMQVRIELSKAGLYRAEIRLDPEHAPPLEGAPPFEVTRLGKIEGVTAAIDPKLTHFAQQLLNGSEFTFDGRAVRPERITFAFDPTAPNDPFAAPPRPFLEVRGKVPAGAKTFAYRCALAVGKFPITFDVEGSAQGVVEWQASGQKGVAEKTFSLTELEVQVPTATVIRRYLVLGFTHILPKGLDHILFVLGLFLLSLRWKPLLAQVTAFTLAHTLTLALSIYGLVSLPSRFVETAIALSIVIIALENLFVREVKKSRVALVFAFGLLHGLGFAGVLTELGLPRRAFLPALLSFNVGVELGQLAVLTVAFALVGQPFGSEPWYRRRVVLPASLAIAAVGLWWAIQRMGG